MVKLIKLTRKKGINMKKLNNFGYILSVLFPAVLFLSYKGEQTLSYLIFLIFLAGMISRKNREHLKDLTDRRIAVGLLTFILTPFIISLLGGGITSRVDTDHYLYWLIFFPLVFFVDSFQKFHKFLASFLIGGLVSLCITLVIFINNYHIWINPTGFEYPRIFFELQTQDFANIMCILLLFLLSFLLFYRNGNRRKEIIIKVVMASILLLDLFIIIVNRSKMVYICLIPAIVYILYRKNKKYILGFIALCLGGYFLLPSSISERLQYIIKIKEDPSSNLRLIFWDAAIASFKKSPLLGMNTEERVRFNTEYFKANGVWDYIDRYYGIEDKIGLTNTHNMYLHHLAYFGVGILSLVFFLFIVIPSRLIDITCHKTKDIRLSSYIALETGLKASYMAYLIQGITEYNLNKKPMIFMCVILLVILNFLYKRKQDKDKLFYK